MEITLILVCVLVAVIALGLIAVWRLTPISYDADIPATESTEKTSQPEESAPTDPVLFASKSGFFSSLKKLIFSATDLEKTLPEIEDALIMADMGIETTEELMQQLQQDKTVKTPDEAYTFIKKKLITWLTPKSEFVLAKKDRPYVIYLVGVNGVGKTTTIGKLACQFKEAGHNVMLVAADTFRAAAVDQLRIWSERNSVSFVGGTPGADPSSVIVDGLRAARAKNMDVVLVDTAGRLHTKTNLMEELRKMSRMCEKEYGHNPDEIFIVLDAVTGQNGLNQADIFFKAIPLTGIVLTKYDSTSKGGILVAVVKKTGLPIRYLGLGEKISDLKKFNADEFVEKMF